MADITDKSSQGTDNLEHDETLRVKKVMPYGWDGTNAVAIKTNSAGELMVSSLVPEKYDYVGLTWTSGNPTTIVFKVGGASGTTIATLTLTFDVDSNPLTITRT
jgi:hypothetical protein